MDDRVIEPSEIVVDQRAEIKENITHVNPWLRLIGRFFDYSFFFLILWVLRNYFHGQFPFSKFEYLIPFEFFVWIPIEALLLSTWGTTPGKFLLKTKLRQGRRERLDYMTALRRSFSVWFRGLGMMIPVMNVFCLLVAYNKLRILHSTSWDRDDQIKVTHYPIPGWRIAFVLFFTIAGLLFYYSDKNSSLKTESSQSGGKRVGRII